MNLSLHMKKNAKKKYRYTGTHWGESFPRDTDITGEEIWRFLNKNKSLNAKLDADPWQGRYTLSTKRPGYHLTENGFYFQRPGEIHHIKLREGESRRIEITLQQTYPLTKDQIIELGKVTANAYFAIYDEGAYLPQVYFDLSTGKFGWKPSTDPAIDENRIFDSQAATAMFWYLHRAFGVRGLEYVHRRTVSGVVNRRKVSLCSRCRRQDYWLRKELLHP